MVNLIFLFILLVSNPTDIIDNPPGTVKVQENFYADRTEITNLDYREFLYWLKTNYGEDSQEYLLQLPETTLLDSQISKLYDLYFKHPEYNHFPVCLISYEQAISYCTWRTDRVNEHIYLKKNKLNSLPKTINNIPKYCVYRLPSVKEWEKLARIDYEEKTIKKLQKKSITKANCHNIPESGFLEVINETKESIPNKIGIYDLFGNIAEMTSTKGIAKGGSFCNTEEDCYVGNNFDYKQASLWLGFRCVCEKSY
ncbi:MAG: SUMF1/EgtB/PvdO family nonheme iron enzyme [Bacteroidales bacterium]|nr:SUMF1/EgtB/PvdO family nonheme iron enzyme [Bacteroidales bacterium]